MRKGERAPRGRDVPSVISWGDFGFARLRSGGRGVALILAVPGNQGPPAAVFACRTREEEEECTVLPRTTRGPRVACRGRLRGSGDRMQLACFGRIVGKSYSSSA